MIQRVRAVGGTVVQTNTDGSCWLSALIVSMSCTPELAQLVDGLTTRAARDRVVEESTKNWDRHYKDFFMNVPRCIPAPSVLIPRVRAVVGAFADLTDTKTKKPLFDDKARKKVDAFIAEIKLGHYSDMPGIVYYKYKLDKKGRVMRDEDGLALLKCNRGTNDVEATHRVINKMLGTSSCGEEFAERLGRWASASLQP